MSKEIDFSVQVKRFPEVKNYQVNLLVIENGKPAEFETHICQTLLEVFERTAAFEAKHLDLFQNAIEYKRVNWRELAAQNCKG